MSKRVFTVIIESGRRIAELGIDLNHAGEVLAGEVCSTERLPGATSQYRSPVRL